MRINIISSSIKYISPNSNNPTYMNRILTNYIDINCINSNCTDSICINTNCTNTIRIASNVLILPLLESLVLRILILITLQLLTYYSLAATAFFKLTTVLGDSRAKIYHVFMYICIHVYNIEHKCIYFYSHIWSALFSGCPPLGLVAFLTTRKIEATPREELEELSPPASRCNSRKIFSTHVSRTIQETSTPSNAKVRSFRQLSFRWKAAKRHKTGGIEDTVIIKWSW